MLTNQDWMANQFYKGLIMLRRLFIRCCILLLFVSNPLNAIAPSQEDEQRFLSLMDSQLGNIINNKHQINGNYLDVKPLQDGGASFINSVYLITTTAGEELIIKIGNPTWKGFKTLNEVSALRYLKHNSSIPVPSVLAYENDAECSLIGAEYIIMPRTKGKPLSLEIDRLHKNKLSYLKVLDQLAEVIAKLKIHKFTHIGNFLTAEVNDYELKIGGIVDFADYKIEEPCKSYSEYAKHALNYYIQEMETLIDKGSPEAKLYIHYIPILKNLLDYPSFLYLDIKEDSFVFSHQDFVMKNILVNNDEVTAILDWEWSGSTLNEIEPMTGFDFLLNEEDRTYFAKKLEEWGISDFFAAPNANRQLFYRLIGNVYTLVAFREWREGKLEHTAKFLSQKLEQRKIRNTLDFDCEKFLEEIKQDLDLCIYEFQQMKNTVQ